MWGVNIQGELAAKMLLAFAPQALSQASGVAEVYVSLKGEGPTPQIQGDITFDPTQPFSLMPRGLRRDIVMTGGSIKFTDEKITLRDLSGSIDDEGRLSGISGEVDLHDWVPVSGDVTLSADGLPFRIPRQLDLVLAADRLKLVWNTIDGASVTGRVEIVQGRYVQDFTLTLADILPSRSTSAPSRPFWEEYPVLGNAHLDLTLDARSFMVENNIANIALSGTMELTGTPRDPRLEGAIQVDRGSFKLQYTRARFTRTRGSVAFSHFSPFPGATPFLDITSEADYRDSSGQDHLITLNLHGPWRGFDWDLSTSSGLNKAQTMTLLLGGNAPSDAQRVTVDPTATDPDRIETSTNPSDSYADQLVKGLTGDFVSLLVADPLRATPRTSTSRASRSRPARSASMARSASSTTST